MREESNSNSVRQNVKSETYWKILASQPKQNRKVAKLLLGNKAFESDYIKQIDFQFVSASTVV